MKIKILIILAFLFGNDLMAHRIMIPYYQDELGINLLSVRANRASYYLTNHQNFNISSFNEVTYKHRFGSYFLRMSVARHASSDEIKEDFRSESYYYAEGVYSLGVEREFEVPRSYRVRPFMGLDLNIVDSYQEGGNLLSDGTSLGTRTNYKVDRNAVGLALRLGFKYFVTSKISLQLTSQVETYFSVSDEKITLNPNNNPSLFESNEKAYYTYFDPIGTLSINFHFK